MSKGFDQRTDRRPPTLVELAGLVARMRDAHEAFLRGQDPRDLVQFKVAEREVDRALALILGPKRRAG